MWIARCLIQRYACLYRTPYMMCRKNLKYISNSGIMSTKTAFNVFTNNNNFSSKSCNNTKHRSLNRNGNESENIDDETHSKTNDNNNAALSDEKIDEILAKYNIEEFYGFEAIVNHKEPQMSEISFVPHTRGRNGVFDLHEVGKVLNETSIKDVCVINVPSDIKYVEFMIIGTGKSFRHILSVAQQLKSMWKQKRCKQDAQTVHIEGMQSSDWLAVDMGNLVLHLFLKETREFYDLESLWTCGSMFEQIKGKDSASLTSETLLLNSNLSKDLLKNLYDY